MPAMRCRPWQRRRRAVKTARPIRFRRRRRAPLGRGPGGRLRGGREPELQGLSYRGHGRAPFRRNRSSLLRRAASRDRDAPGRRSAGPRVAGRGSRRRPLPQRPGSRRGRSARREPQARRRRREHVARGQRAMAGAGPLRTPARRSGWSPTRARGRPVPGRGRRAGPPRRAHAGDKPREVAIHGSGSRSTRHSRPAPGSCGTRSPAAGRTPARRERRPPRPARDPPRRPARRPDEGKGRRSPTHKRPRSGPRAPRGHTKCRERPFLLDVLHDLEIRGKRVHLRGGQARMPQELPARRGCQRPCPAGALQRNGGKCAGSRACRGLPWQGIPRRMNLTPLSVTRPPRWLMKTAWTASGEAPEKGACDERHVTYCRSEEAAEAPRNTLRSLEPFPRTRALEFLKSMSPMLRETS